MQQPTNPVYGYTGFSFCYVLCLLFGAVVEFGFGLVFLHQHGTRYSTYCIFCFSCALWFFSCNVNTGVTVDRHNAGFFS